MRESECTLGNLRRALVRASPLAGLLQAADNEIAKRSARYLPKLADVMASRSAVWALLGLLLLVLLLRQRGGFSVATAVLEPQRATQVLEQFTTASSDDWPGRSYGNHRARLRLDGGGLAWARVEWRLPGLAMQDRTLLLIDERTGSPVHNLHVVSASSEAAEILFEAKVWEDNPNPDPNPNSDLDPGPNPDPDPGAAGNRGRQREAAAALGSSPESEPQRGRHVLL